ncbi:type I 3-dehydroquinate dehydratase [Sorangium sp. So ce381]|uniref:type I 3-dehydroquinate dehydratase n=1 Tax=Sorangium sp. So ce381 TaxID=3133307 RepID=UPI003F5BA6D0
MRVREIVPEVALIATLTRPPSRSGEELTALPARVRFVEVRADRVGSVDPGVLRRHFNGKLVYSLRSRREGGSFDGELAARHERLIAAAERYDRVDLEAERDLVPRVLERIPPERRVISWHGTAADRWDYRDRLGVLDRAAAWLYRVVPTVTHTAEALAALEFLADLGRRDVTAFAAGPAGTWTSLLAPRLGAPVAFGAVERREPDAGRSARRSSLPTTGCHRSSRCASCSASSARSSRARCPRGSTTRRTAWPACRRCTCPSRRSASKTSGPTGCGQVWPRWGCL